MVIGVPKETYPGERRVALTPAVIASLAKGGLDVLVERGAGIEAGYPDHEFEIKGAKLVQSRSAVFAGAHIITQVLCYGANDVNGAADMPLLRRDHVLVGFLRPLGSQDILQQVAATGVRAFSVEMMPRTTRAQSMDALSSMSTIAGYKAVLIAADLVPRIFPMLTTAAGTITPARVLVIGAGVAGLQAIATARRLGAVVSAYDVRPAAKEQVQSLGGRFVELPLEAQGAQDERGYARAQGEEFYAKQRELLGRVVAESDVVITTAVVPGKKAPVLVTRDMVRGMAPGSVVIDLAAERGGNCEITRGAERVEENGVKVIGAVNLASTVPYHASQMYAKNLTSFLLNLVKKSELNVNMEDDIIRDTLITQNGEIVNGRVRQFYSLPELVASSS